MMSSTLQSSSAASQLEKKQRQFDKTVAEWQRKTSDLQHELEGTQRESRGYAAEIFKLKASIEDDQDVINGLKRENKNLSGTRLLQLVKTCLV